MLQLATKNSGRYFYSVFSKDVGVGVPEACCGKHFPEICKMDRSTFLLFTIHSSIQRLPFTFAFSATLKTTETHVYFRARLKEWQAKTIYVNTDNKYWQ